MEIPGGGGKSCQALWNRKSWGVGAQTGKIPPWGVWIFSGNTHSASLAYMYMYAGLWFGKAPRKVVINSKYLKCLWNLGSDEVFRFLLCNIQGDIGFQRLPNFCMAKVTMSPYCDYESLTFNPRSHKGSIFTSLQYSDLISKYCKHIPVDLSQ